MECDDPPLVQLRSLYLRHQESRGLSPCTLKNCRQTLDSLARYGSDRGLALSASSFTADLLRDYHGWLKQTPLLCVNRGGRQRSAGGIAARMRVVRAFVRFLADEGLLPEAPRVRVPKVPQHAFRVFTDNEVDAIRSCRHLSGDSEAAIRNRALVNLMLDSGLRLSEVAGLEVADLHLEDRLAKVTGKGGKDRFVPFGRAVALYLEEWLEVRGRHTGSLFELKARGVDALFRRLERDLGFKIHPHAARHYAATQMVRRGMDIYALKRVLGHAHISTSEVYLTLSNADIRDQHERFSPIDDLETRRPTRIATRRRLLTREKQAQAPRPLRPVGTRKAS